MAYNEDYYKEIIMEKAKMKIKKAWEEDPLQVIAIGALAATAAAKLIDAGTKASNSRAWKKEVDRRDRMSR